MNVTALVKMDVLVKQQQTVKPVKILLIILIVELAELVLVDVQHVLNIPQTINV